MMRRFSTIVTLSVITVAIFGCSPDPESNDDTGIDMTLADAGESDMSSEDSGGTDSGPDVTLVNPEVCDPVRQDCVEPDAPICGTVFPSDNTGTQFVCRESLGDAGPGEPCTRRNDVAGEDDCTAGNFCSGYGLPITAPQARVCRAMCRAHADCAVDARCIALDSRGTVGMCTDLCDPQGNDCVEGAKCSIFFSALSLESYWVCSNDARADVGDLCAGSQQCGAGQWCPYNLDPSVRQCQAFCADSLRCADGGACAPEAMMPGYGMCKTVDWSCAGTPWPAASAAQSDVTVNVKAGAASVPNAVVTACASDDADCAAPIASGTTGPSGSVTVTVPTGASGFDGYFEVTAAGHLTELLHATAPIGSSAVSLTATLAPDGPSTAPPFAWAGDVGLDPARGHIASVIEPCTASGGGAQVILTSDLADASTTTGYVSEIGGTGLLDPAVTSTTINGRAAMANHPAGSPTLTYTNSEGAVVATRQVVVRAGALTFVWVEPTP